MAPYGMTTAGKTMMPLGGQALVRLFTSRSKEGVGLGFRPDPRLGILHQSLNGLDSLHPNNLGNLLLENSLNAVGQRELRHRAAAACPLKLNLYDSLISDIDESHITAVGLKRRANLIEYRLNSFLVHSDPPQLGFAIVRRHSSSAPVVKRELYHNPYITGQHSRSTSRSAEMTTTQKSRRMYSAASYSPTAYAAVPSALEGLTTGFGMGPGVPPPQ